MLKNVFHNQNSPPSIPTMELRYYPSVSDDKLRKRLYQAQHHAQSRFWNNHVHLIGTDDHNAVGQRHVGERTLV